MKRLHIHVSVENMETSIEFYSILFAARPSVVKPDYAKWMLEDPRVNFALSRRTEKLGVDHLGIQVEAPGELQEVYSRLRDAGRPILEEGATTCCYAKSEKSWIADPQGLLRETFLTTGESTAYGNSVDLDALQFADGACCTPETPQGVCCAPKSALAADASCCEAIP